MDSGGDDDTIGGLEEAFGEDQTALMSYMEEVLGEQFDVDFFEELKKTDLFADVLKDFNSGGGGTTPGPPGSTSNQSVASRRSSSENRVANRDNNQTQTSGPSRKSQQVRSSAISAAIANHTKRSSEERITKLPDDSARRRPQPPSHSKLKKKKNKEVKSRAVLDSSSSSDSDKEHLAQQRRQLQKKLKDKLKIQSSSVASSSTHHRKERKGDSLARREDNSKKKSESKFKSRALLSSSSSESESEDLVRQREQLRKKLKEKLKIKPWASTTPSSSSSKKDKKVDPPDRKVATPEKKVEETSTRKVATPDKKVQTPVRKVEPVESPVNKVVTSLDKTSEASQKKPEKRYRPGPKSKKLGLLSQQQHQQLSTTATPQQFPPRIPSKDEFNHHPRPSLNLSPASSAQRQSQKVSGRRKETLHLTDLMLVSSLFPSELQEDSPICITSKLLEEVRQCEMKYRLKCNNCSHSKPLRKIAPFDRETNIPKEASKPPETTKNDQKPTMSPQKSSKTFSKSPLRKEGDNEEIKRKPFGPLSASPKKTGDVPVSEKASENAQKTETAESKEKPVSKSPLRKGGENEEIKRKPFGPLSASRKKTENVTVKKSASPTKTGDVPVSEKTSTSENVQKTETPESKEKPLSKSPLRKGGDNEEIKRKPFGPLSASLKKTENVTLKKSASPKKTGDVPASEKTSENVQKTEAPPESKEKASSKIPPPSPEAEKKKAKPQPISFGFDKLSVLNATLNKAKIRKSQEEAVMENKPCSTPLTPEKAKSAKDEEDKTVPPPPSMLHKENKNEQSTEKCLKPITSPSKKETLIKLEPPAKDVHEKKLQPARVANDVPAGTELISFPLSKAQKLEKEESTLTTPSKDNTDGGIGTLMEIEAESGGADKNEELNVESSEDKNEELNVESSEDKNAELNVEPSEDENAELNVKSSENKIEELGVGSGGDKSEEVKVESDGDKNEKVKDKSDRDKIEELNVASSENRNEELNVESSEDKNEQLNVESCENKIEDKPDEENIEELNVESDRDKNEKVQDEPNKDKSEKVDHLSTTQEEEKAKESVPDEITFASPAPLHSADEKEKKLDSDDLSSSAPATTEVENTNQTDNDDNIAPLATAGEETAAKIIKDSNLAVEGSQVEEAPEVEQNVTTKEEDKPLDDKVTVEKEAPSSSCVDLPPGVEEDNEQIKTESDPSKVDLTTPASEDTKKPVHEETEIPLEASSSATADDDFCVDVVDDTGPPSPGDNDNFGEMPSPPHSPAMDADDSPEASSPEEIIGGGSKKSPDRPTSTPKKKAIIESSSDDDHRREDTTDEDVTPERKKSIDDDDESVVATGSVKKGVRFAIPNPSIERKRDQEYSRSSGKFNEFEMERQRKRDKTRGGKKDKHGKMDPFEDFKKEKQLCNSFRIPKTATPVVKHVPHCIITPLSAINVPKEKIQFEKFRKGLSDKKDWKDKSGGKEWNNNRNFRGSGDGSQDFRGDKRFDFDRHKARDDGRGVVLAGDPDEAKREDEPFGGNSPPGGTIVPEREPLWANDGEEPGGGDSPPPDGNTGNVDDEGGGGEWEDNTVSSGEQVTMKMSDVKDGKLEGTTTAVAVREEETISAALLQPEVEVKSIEVNAFAVGAVMYLQENPEPELPDVEVEKNLAEATMMRVAWWFYKADFENALKDVASRSDWYKILIDDVEYSDDDDAKSDSSYHDQLKWSGAEDEEIYHSLSRELQRRKSNGAVDEQCGRQLLVSEYRSGPEDKFSKIFQIRGSGDPKVIYDAKEKKFQARCTVCDFLVVGRNELASHVLSVAHKEKMSRAGLGNLSMADEGVDNDKEISIKEEKKTEVQSSEKIRHTSGATPTTSIEKKDEFKIQEKDKSHLDSKEKRPRSQSPTTTQQLKRNRSRSPVPRYGRGRGRRGERDRSPRKTSRSRSPHDGSGRRRRSRSRDRPGTKERIVREPIVRISRSPRRHRRSPERVVEKTEPKSKTHPRSRSRSPPSNNRNKRHRHDSPPAPEHGMLPTHLTTEVDEKRALTLESKWTEELEKKWKLMEAEEAVFIEKFTEKRKSLQTAPEKHPDYGEAWTAFWERRYNEIEQEGKEDPDKHNFVPEWKEYWTKKMNGILDREYELEIKDIKKRHGVDVESLRKFRRSKVSTDDWKTKSKPVKPRQPPPPPKIQVPPQVQVPSPPSTPSVQKKVEPLPVQPTRPPSSPSIAGTVTPSSPSMSGEEEDEERVVTTSHQPTPIPTPQKTTAIETTSTSTSVTTSTVDVISTWDRLEKNASFLATSFMTSPAHHPTAATQQAPPSYLGSIVSIVPAAMSSIKSFEESCVDDVEDDVDSSASIDSYEFRGGMDVVEVLYHMTKLEEQLGFFADQVKEYFKSAEEMDLQKRNKSYSLLTDAYFVAVLFQIRERFTSLAQTQILPRDVVDNFNLTVDGLNGILDHPSCQKRRPPVPTYMPHVPLPPPPLPEREPPQQYQPQQQQSLPPLPREQPLPSPPQEPPPLPPQQPEPPQQRQARVPTPTNFYDTFTRPQRRPLVSPPTSHQSNTSASALPDFERKKEVNVYDTFTRPSSSSRLFSNQSQNPFLNVPEETRSKFATQLTHFLMSMGAQDLSDGEIREMLGKMSCKSTVSSTPKPCAISLSILEQWRTPHQNTARFYSGGVASSPQYVPNTTALPETPNVVPRFQNPRSSGPRPLLSVGFDRRDNNVEGGGAWNARSWEYGQRQNIPGSDRDTYMSSNYFPPPSHPHPPPYAANNGRQTMFTGRNVPRNPNLSYPRRDGSR